MPTKQLKTEVEISDFVRGCTFLGTGGGGSPDIGRQFLTECLKEGKEVGWIDVSEMKDDVWTCTPFYMGSIAPQGEQAKEKMRQLGLSQEKVARTAVSAVKVLEEYTQTKVGAIVAFEIGGINTPAPMDVAARLGIPTVDADASGRALPEVVQGLVCLNQKKATPITCCDQWGNVTIIKEAANYATAEMLGKLISLLSFGLCGEAGFLLKWQEVKDVLIPGTLSRAYNIGRAIREARESGADPVAAAIAAVEGWRLFTGVVAKRETEDRDGYYWGINTIEGTDKFKGHTMKIFFKNENHVTWRDDQVYVTSPDIIEVVELKTAEPITNTDLKEGDTVAVIGAKNEKYRTKEGIEIIGPKHYGYDIEYVPIENRVK
jgi:DUF917 family protein